jgi:arylsulfatase A-like enzyme
MKYAVPFLLLNLSVPLLIRFFFSKPSISGCIGFLQDLFIALELFLLLSFSAAITALFGFLCQVIWVLDFFLYRKMHLRMRLGYFYHLRHPRSLVHSAEELGLHRFLGCAALLGALQILGVLFFYDRLSISWIEAACVSGVGVLAAWGAHELPPETAYRVNSPLFQEQIDLFRRLFSLWKKKETPAPSLRCEDPCTGPKTFDIEIHPEEKPHIVWLFLESFAASAVGTGATPRFDQFSQEGILFSNFYSNGTLTYRALVSSLLGCPPGSTSRGLFPYLNAPLESLPKRLKKAGYQSAFHHNGSLGYDYQREFLEKHFDQVADKSDIEDLSNLGWGLCDESLMQFSADFLEKQKDPTFLTLFTISNHHPWIVPEHYSAPSFPAKAPKNRFLQTVHYTDFSLGRFVDQLRSKNLAQKTILFILGDHGQPMGEHADNFYNSRFLYEENVHVPLLILADGRIQRPMIDDAIGSQIDLMPTLLDLLGIDHPCFGSSLMRVRPQRRAMLQNPYSEGFMGCREGSWKWIENGLSKKGELYDLGQDPKEKNNLEADLPLVAEWLRADTRQFFAGIDQLYQNKECAIQATRELDLSSQLITDQALIDRLFPAIQKLNLQNCLLITDQAISSVLSHCSQLEELHLQGLTDLSDAMFAGAPLQNKLQAIHLPDADKITDRGVGRLAQIAPRLGELSLNARSLTDEGIRAIADSCHHLVRLKLFSAQAISEDVLIALFQNNPHLGRIVIDGGVHLTDRALVSLQKHPLELLWLFDAPLLTDRGLQALSHLPIRSLALRGCPLLRDRIS